MKTKIASLAALFLLSMSAHAADAPAPDGSKVSSPVELSASFDLVSEVTNMEPTPEELRQIKKLWTDMRLINETPASDQPRPTISMVNLDLSAGSTPPLVRVSNQTGVILTFMDANGRKWPVERVVNLSDKEIDVEEKPALKDQNSVYAKAKRAGGIGNLAVFLREFDTPVVITLLAGQKDVDYRKDFRVPALIGGGSPIIARSEFDDRLVSAVMGITPPGCQPEKVSNRQISAWRCGDDLIIKGGGILLSPASIDGRRISGQGGMNAWLIPSTPVVTMMANGVSGNIKIGGQNE